MILSLHGHEDWVQSDASYPDGRRIVTASFDRTAQLWNAFQGRWQGTLFPLPRGGAVLTRSGRLGAISGEVRPLL